MSQPRQILKNTVVLTVSDLIDKVGNIVVTLIIARLLHASGLGVYSTATTYYSVIALSGAMGAMNFLVREIARDLAKTNRYVVHLAVLGIGVSAALIALLLAVLPVLHYSPELATSTYVIILAIIPGTLVIIQEAVFVAHQRTEFITATKLLSTIVNVVISLVLLLYGYGVVSLLIAFVIEQYLVTICYFYCINRFICRLHWEFELAYVPTLVREIKTFAALSLLAALFARPEVIMLSILKDDAATGYYSAALKIVSLWYFLPQIFMTNVYPVLSRSYQQTEAKFQLIQDKSLKYLLVVSLPLTVGMIAAARPIVYLFNGPGFDAAVPILRILAWSLLLNALNAVLWRVLAARNQQHLDLRTRIVTIIVRLGGSYVFIVALAAYGAAVATVLSLVLNVLMLLYYVNQGAFKLQLVRIGWRSAAASAGMGFAIWWVAPSLSLVALIPLAGCVYLGLVYLLNIFSAEDIALFRQVLRPQQAKEA
ncbi:MAG: flippase [Caldilineaceae bacterium]